MEFSNETIKYIIILLALVIIGYTIFLLYKDAMNTRSEIIKIKNNISELSENINGFKELSDHDHFTDEDYDDEDEDEDDDEDIEEDNSKSNILDQLLLGSKQLHNLQELQSEIEGTKIVEINEDEDKEEDVKDIEFISSETPKCESILKSGKNKGTICKRDALTNTTFCKIHQE